MVKSGERLESVPTIRAGLAERTDEELVRAIVQGNEAALTELYGRHADTLFRAAVMRLGDRQLAEEVLQDTYLALWNRAELFDPGQGSLLAWLSTIARNRAVDVYRRLRRRPGSVSLSGFSTDGEGNGPTFEALLDSAIQPLNGGVQNPEQWLDGVWLKTEVSRALESIPDQESQVIRLAYYEQLTQREIATRLDWPLGTVKTRTRRALSRLRDTLADALGPELGPRFATRADSQRGGDADGPR